MSAPLLKVALRFEDDVVGARQRARQIAGLLKFDSQDQTRIATAVSEIARNAVSYGGGGRAEFYVDGERSPQQLRIEIRDEGPGIADLDLVLSGRYRSQTGMGMGIMGAKRLLDGCEIETSSRGTCAVLRKYLPRTAPTVTATERAALLGKLEDELRARPTSLLDEVRQQNHELVKAMEEIEGKRAELQHLNGELFDTNRGVLALYAELEEKADNLRRADELKTRFLSNMSHEFRTPLNSILALARLLTDQVDGLLTVEQQKQVGYIDKSAAELLELVDDLLDLAKVEAGKISLRQAEFSVDDLFAALRGMLRPMVGSSRVELIFEDAAHIPRVYGDEAKLGQIVRNFLSNALKFTERGEIRVVARHLRRGEAPLTNEAPCAEDSVLIGVHDTGIGLSAVDCERVFEEFSQVDSPLQRRVKGTGLGLPLCKKLATVLGGRVWVESTPGKGSCFSVLIPRQGISVEVREAV